MIVREPGRHRWVVIDQAVIRNPTLSYRARGILATLLSMPDHWEVNSEWLAMMGSEGRDAIRAALRELEAAGHMIRHKAQTADGRWTSHWVVYEQPVDRGGEKPVTEDGFPGVGFPGANRRNTEKEVLIPKALNMITKTKPRLCTTCRGSGKWIDWAENPQPCNTCGGEGIDGR